MSGFNGKDSFFILFILFIYLEIFTLQKATFLPTVLLQIQPHPHVTRILWSLSLSMCQVWWYLTDGRMLHDARSPILPPWSSERGTKIVQRKSLQGLQGATMQDGGQPCED